MGLLGRALRGRQGCSRLVRVFSRFGYRRRPALLNVAHAGGGSLPAHVVVVDLLLGASVGRVVDVGPLLQVGRPGAAIDERIRFVS